MPIKRKIYGDFTTSASRYPVADTSKNAAFIRQEAERRRDEERRNEMRFDQYNQRLRRENLPEIPYTDFLARKYGTFDALKRAQRALNIDPSNTPENRDNIVLFTR